MAEMNVTSTRLFAEATNIPWGSLKNGLAGRDPLTLARVYRIAKKLTRKGETVRAVVDEIVATDDGVPDTPPDQTKPKSKPERRKERNGNGPKRESERGVA